MTKHITKIRPQGQLVTNDIDSSFIKDGSITQADIAVGTFTGDVFVDGGIATKKLADAGKLAFTDGSTSNSADMDMGGNKVVNLKPGVNSTDAVNKSQLDAVVNNMSVFEWQSSVSAIALDPTQVSPIIGSRYLINGSGVGVWSGHDFQIAEYTSSAYPWSFVSPTIGTVVVVDGVNDRMYLWNGTSWGEMWFEVTTASSGLYKSGFDIRVNPSSAGSGLEFEGGAFSVVAGNGLIVSQDAVAIDTGYTANKIPQYTQDGKLGIGMGQPEATLHVSGSTKLSGSVDISGTLTSADVVVNGSQSLVGKYTVATPDAFHGTIYFNQSDKKLHLKTDVSEHVIGLEYDVISGEIPAESPDDVRTGFTLVNIPIVNSEAVYLNGIRLIRDQDYSMNGNTIIFVDPPGRKHVICVDYRREVLI